MTGRGLRTLGFHPSQVRTEGGTRGHVTLMCLSDSRVGSPGEQRSGQELGGHGRVWGWRALPLVGRGVCRKRMRLEPNPGLQNK